MLRQNCKVGPAICFTKAIEEYEVGFDEGMKAVICDIRPEQAALGYQEFLFDFASFEEENKVLGKANYWDQNGHPTLKWHESRYYPADKKECVYINTIPTNEAPWVLLSNAYPTPEDQEITKLLAWTRQEGHKLAEAWIMRNWSAHEIKS